ncbi:hypothetical protein JO972_01015 [Verrucomicrobiaceae bacterium 5K15]|uniref:Uncharacterized protein n=1 Tax=Oceaniferula flava TaxID=2800421 RepID=A0AAE2VCP9_9BACT|nr:hypothetical protein [Oceaniferula flavus]MBK1853529.1 hypothetical protein [Oceaniferula flavus]MBM1134834.1 hypothetical protein [Oceaniferula flavus]
MVLLVMIALAMLSLSTLELRQSGRSENQAVAQANARMALMLAIGQLQRTAGPDQRVTATASIFDSSPETLEIDGVALPHALGAWSTLTDAGDPIIYQAGDGYHADHRNPGDSDFIDHRENPMTWLISGGDEDGFDPRSLTLSEGSDGVVMGFDQGQQILAPLVTDQTGGSGSARGAYAYHVTDLGMAAPIVQYNKNLTAEPSSTSADNGGYANLYTGTKRPYDTLTETSGALTAISEDSVVEDERTASRYISYRSAGINPDGSANDVARELLHNYDQEFTHYNSALFVDTLNGGLRTDLTPYFQSSADPGEGGLSGSNGTLFADTDPLLEHDRFNLLSPKFGALRDFMKLGDEAGNDRSIAPRAAIYGGGANNDYPDPTKVVKHGVHPYIAEYSMYTRPVINSSSSSNMSLLIYPRVTLWNPYNVAIDTSGYFVQINQRGYFQLITDDDVDGNGSNDAYTFTSSYWGSALSGDGSKARPSYFFFYLDPVKIEPGQALVFTPAHNGTQKIEFRDGSIANNRLSASADINDLNCFYVDMGGTAADTNKDLQYKFKRYWENGYHIGYEESTSARLRIANSTPSYSQIIGGSDDDPNFPIVHTLDIHNWIRGNEGRWHDINRPWLPVLDMSSANTTPPDNRTKLGMRLKAFYETVENTTNQPNGYWDFPLLEMANMRAPFYRRTPWDWLFQNPTVLHEYSFGPLAGDNQEQPGYLDPFMLPRYVSGVSESSPFLDSSSASNLRYVLFDVPPADMEVFSIGQLRQAPLTHEFSAPSFIIGESLVPVTSPRDQSAFSASEYSSIWWNGLRESRVPSYATWWQDELDPSNQYAAYDFRYETNLALWDKYFFSTLPEGDTLEIYTDAGTLPHPNMRVVNDAGLDLSQADLTKPDVIARNLRLTNHHSVNSTSAIAWKALLSMNMGLDIDGNSTDDESVPFPGTSSPMGDGVGLTSSEDEDAWSGYRQLSSDEIDLLAQKIVEQVKRRAPFISMSDFVNRRLRSADIDTSASPDVSGQSDEDLLSYAGPIEVAIRKASLNAGMQDFTLKSTTEYVSTSSPAERFATANTPTERFANAPAHLTQGKVLETIGATLTPRSDTFRVRAYGESRDSDGNVNARAWCEAIVQRSSEYVDSISDEATVAFDDLTSEVNKTHGRRFNIQSFRWLSANEMNDFN